MKKDIHNINVIIQLFKAILTKLSILDEFILLLRVKSLIVFLNSYSTWCFRHFEW